MVLADLGRKITTALRSLSSATVINEEVSPLPLLIHVFTVFMLFVIFPVLGFKFYAERNSSSVT